MNGKIDHTLLDHYETLSGDPKLLANGHNVFMELWELVDELMLDLHLIRHGYADEGYARHVDRELARHCIDGSVVERMKALRF